MEKKRFFHLDSDFFNEEFIYENKACSRYAYIDLFILALDKDKTTRLNRRFVDGKRGCVYMTQTELAKRWRWSRGAVAHFLNIMQDMEKIEMVKLPSVNCKVIKVLDYDLFSGED